MTVFYVIISAALLVSIAGMIARAIRYARQPVHLRWELYPVPHEAPERAAHGGSYFEEVDWWTRPARFSFWGEVKAMAPEMLFLRGLWTENRQLWYRSFPFHFGLYLAIAGAALMLVFRVGALVGAVGAALVVLGAGALLHRRLTDPELRPYTAPGDIFNLILFIVTFGVLLAGYALRIPGLLLAGVTMAALLAAYIPFTHMSHFIAKYFTYHSVRWDDQPLVRRRELERKMATYLSLRPTWSAPHVGADGRKTWADVAAANPFAGARK